MAGGAMGARGRLVGAPAMHDASERAAAASDFQRLLEATVPTVECEARGAQEAQERLRLRDLWVRRAAGATRACAHAERRCALEATREAVHAP